MVTRSRSWSSRICGAVAVVALAVLPAACGSGTSDTADSGSGGGKTTLTMKAITDNQKSWQQLIAQYKKANPDVTIKASFAPTDQLQTALRAQLGAGGAPDMFVVWPGNGSAMSVKQLAPTGLLADLSDQDWVKSIPEDTRPLLGVKDKTFMWSPSTTPIGVIYNKRALKQAGVSKLPTTYDEFLAACEKVKKAGKVPVALGLQTPWVTQLVPYAIAPATAFADAPNLALESGDVRAGDGRDPGLPGRGQEPEGDRHLPLPRQRRRGPA